jgi:hypothetical protein
VVGTILSILLFVGVATAVVILKKQRRAAWNDAQYGDTRGGIVNNGDSRFFQPGTESQSFGPNSSQNAQPGGSFTPNPPQPKVLSPGVTETQPEGGIFANKLYREYREDGAILIGFEVGLGEVPDTAVVTYLRPIWLTAKGEQFGTAYGRTKYSITTVKARDGYAIGGIRIKGGGAIEGLCFTFMRCGEKHLIAEDFYISDWYGEQTRKLHNADQPCGDGGFVIGIYGKRFEDKGGTKFEESGGIGTIGLTRWVKQ